MEAVILAGGFGTRLADVVKDVPKPMAPVGGRPFLEFVLDDLIAQGIDRIHLAVCHKKESIMNHFGRSYRDAEILYSVEDRPLMTGGAVRLAMEQCQEERVFVLNGDTFFRVDIQKLRAFSQSHAFPFVMTVRKMEECSRYGMLELGDDGAASGYAEKEHGGEGFINGGFYDMARTALRSYPERFSLEEEYIPKAMSQGDVGAVPFSGFFIDIGIPEDYARAQRLLGSNGYA